MYRKDLFTRFIHSITKGSTYSIWTVVASSLLLIIALLPLISSLSGLSLITDWYRVATNNSWPLIIFGFFSILLIWLYLYSILAGFLRHQVLQGKLLDVRDIKKNYRYFALFGLILVVLFFAGLVVVNQKENTSRIVFVAILLFSLATLMMKVVFPLVRIKLVALSTNASDEKLRLIAATAYSLGINVYETVHGSLSYSNYLRQSFLKKHSEYIRKNRELPSLPKNDKSIDIYIEFIKQLGFWALLLIPLMIITMAKTSPNHIDHGKLVVAFYITILLIVVVFVVVSILFDELTKGSFLFARDWMSEKATQFGNRYVLIPIIIGLLLLSMFFTFSTQSEPLNTKTSIGEIVHDSQENPANCFNSQEQKPLIIVAASGGGIAASAWTANVLRKLEIEFPEIYECIMAVSSVSGGSLGTYYHISEKLLRKACIQARLEEGLPSGACNIIPPRSTLGLSLNLALESIQATSIELASRSSLGAVAWGVANPFYDRSSTLQTRWSTIHCEEGKKMVGFDACNTLKSILGDNFESWSKMDESTAPHALINTTLQDEGKRVILSTNKDFGSIIPSNFEDSTSDTAIYNSACIGSLKVVEAVKHSANFPYVSNATGIDLESTNCGYDNRSFYLDAGYIDNEGIQTALDYIDYLRNHSKHSKILLKRKFIILNLEAFPESTGTNIVEKNTFLKPFDQLLSPAFGLANIRKSHSPRNKLDVKRASNSVNDIVSLEISFHRSSKERARDLPLSWHLTPAQKSWISAELHEIKAVDVKQITLSNNFIKYCTENEDRLTLIEEFACLETNFSNSETDTFQPKTYNLEKIYELSYQNNQHLQSLSQMANEASRSERWMKVVTPKYCNYADSPKLIALSPLFKIGLPASSDLDGVWFEGLSTQCNYKPNCAQAEVDSYFISNRHPKRKVHILGFASEEKTSVFNLNLAERRAKWLKNALLRSNIFTLKSEQITTHSLGEGAYLPHPIKSILNNSTEKNLNRYALAFSCN